MNKRKAYHVGGLTFATKAALTQHVQAILNGNEFGEPLSEEDFQFMLSLLDRHQERDQKIGCGVADIRVQQNPEWKTRMFVITRQDGSSTDFSYKVCLTPTTPLDNFKGACRSTVSKQIRDFKVERFRNADSQRRVRCDLTGALVTMEESHVDHAPPMTFEKILADFINEKKIVPDEVETTGHGDNETVLGFADPDLTIAFDEYHRKHAQLRLVATRVNLSDVRRDQPRNP